MSRTRSVAVLSLILIAAGCGGSSSGGGAGLPQAGDPALRGGPPVFAQPAGTVAVDFSVDDTANRVYAAGGLKMKGSFLYDEETRLVIPDYSWSGAAPGAPPLSGWPTLYDDGPWTEGGHEPVGARARDHVWGVTMFATPPPYGANGFQYGLIDVGYETALGNGWIWKGSNGGFDVVAGASAPIEARGAKLERFGETDLRLSIDTTRLSPTFWAPSPTSVSVKASTWGWGLLPMRSLGGGVYELELSDLVGRRGTLPRTGLLKAGDTAEFVFVLDGVEYKGSFLAPWGWTWASLPDGVTASLAPEVAHRFVPTPVDVSATTGNTLVRVPGCYPEPGVEGPACGREGHLLVDPGFEGVIPADTGPRSPRAPYPDVGSRRSPRSAPT